MKRLFTKNKLMCLVLFLTMSEFAFAQQMGVKMVQDINPGSGYSSPSDLVVMGANLFFRASDGTNGQELWKTDGTTVTLVQELNPGNQGSDPVVMTPIGSEMFFNATDGTNGQELWKTDGDTIILVKDIQPGAGASHPHNFKVIGAQLYFVADDGVHGNELWKSDGVTTTLVQDINTGSAGSFPSSLTVVGADLYFAADNGINGVELWKTNGTTTSLVQDIRVGSASSNPENLTGFGSELFFSAEDGTNGAELWKTDGTTTTLVADINNGSGSSNLQYLSILGSELFFVADNGINGAEVWKTNGTIGNATMVMNINTGILGSRPYFLTVFGTEIFFVADNGLNGWELWKTDGTTTVMVKDIYPGSFSSTPSEFTVWNSELYFTAYEGTNGQELWKTDGVNTTLVKDVYPGLNSSVIRYMKVFNSELYFSSVAPGFGRELLKVFPCQPINSSFAVSLNECAKNGYTVPSGKVSYNSIGTYTVNDTLQSSCRCDSILTITIAIKPQNQSVSATDQTLCATNTGTEVITESNEGFVYYLRDNSNDSILEGPMIGTDSTVMFSTGTINNDFTYNVYGKDTSITALDFGGASDLKKVDLGTDLWTDSFEGKTQLTVEAWINRSTLGNLHTIASCYEGGIYPFLFRIDSDKLSLYINSGAGASATSTNNLPVGTWTHVAGTYDGNNVKVYINGAEQGSTAHSTNLMASSNDLKIGGGLANNSEYFAGSIADVRFWSAAKTQVEISTNMSNVLEGNEANLVAYYNFNNIAGDSIVNQVTGNTYTGRLINAPLTVLGPELQGGKSCEMSQPISITVLNPVSGTTVDTTINEGESLTVGSNIYTAEGTYTDTLSSAQNCDSIVTTNVTVISGINSSLVNGLSVYPNPTEENILLTVKYDVLTNLSYRLYDLRGQLLENRKISSSNVNIELQQLPKSIYFLKVLEGNKEVETFKIVKQ